MIKQVQHGRLRAEGYAAALWAWRSHTVRLLDLVTIAIFVGHAWAPRGVPIG